MWKKLVYPCLYFALSVSGAVASDAVGSPPGGNPVFQDAIQPAALATPESMVITGQVRFEKRFTRVSEVGCFEESCPQSQAYWSLEVQSGPNRYVLNRILNLGEEEAPEFLELGNVPLRPGTNVLIEGQVIKGHPYFILVSVHRVELLMD